MRTFNNKMLALPTLQTPDEYLDEIRKKGSQNLKNWRGIPTLCSAIHEFRSAYLVEELLKDGAEVNAYSLKISRFGVGTEAMRFRRWGDFSAIHLAVSLGQYEVVRLLFENGADLESKTTKGIEPLHFVLDSFQRCLPDDVRIIERDDLEILQLMYQSGLDLNKKNKTNHSTILHRAILHNYPNIVRYLISVGFDVNCVDETSSTPLHYCNEKTMECARILLENKANPNAKNNLGNTVYHLVLRGSKYKERPNSSVEFLRFLHKFNANPNIENNLGRTALHVFLQNMEIGNVFNTEVVDFMLRHGADSNVRDVFDRTPIHYLASILEIENPDVLGLFSSLLTKLVHFGAKLDHRDITGTTVLHTLINGHLLYPKHFDAKLWNEILYPKYNVNVNVQDFENRTVLHLVSAKGEWNLAEIFLRHGGNMDVLDCDGNTPLDVAILCKQWEYARRLSLWPFLVDKHRQLKGSGPSVPVDIDNCVTNTSRLFKSLTLINTNSGSRCDSSAITSQGHYTTLVNNNSNSGTSDNSNKSNNNQNNSNDNQNKSNNHHQNYSDSIQSNNAQNSSDNNPNNTNISQNNNCDCNQIQMSFNAPNQLRRRNSMSSIESSRKDRTCVIPVGSRVKWTTNTVATLATLVAERHNDFYSRSLKRDLRFWDSEYCLTPKVSEQFSTQITKSSLQRLCEENSLEFHLTEKCGEEHCLLARQVLCLVKDLLKKCSEMDPRLTSELHWTGSSAEGTKMWLPDEFDFLMELIKLRGCCSIDGSLCNPRKVILNQVCKPLWSNLTLDAGHITPYLDDFPCLSSIDLRRYIAVLLWKASFQLNKQNYPNIQFDLISYNRNPNCFLKDTKVGVNLTVCWKGKLYKNLMVSIDVTPAIPVIISERQISELNEHACEIISDSCVHVVPYVSPGNDTIWRASFSLIEVRVVKSLTRKQISLYKCLKFLRDLHKDLFSQIPSYHLKSFLVGTVFRDPFNSEMIRRENFYSSISRIIYCLKETAEYPKGKMSIKHFFIENFFLAINDYDMRWCSLILDHLESN